jgi:peptidylprolyl isomerase
MHKNLVKPVVVVVVLLVGSVLVWMHIKQSSEYVSSQQNSDQTSVTDAIPEVTLGGSPQVPAGAAPQSAPINQNNKQKIMNATLHTNKGDITIEFLPQITPNTVANFIKLVQAGFYDGVKFHRVIKDFMIQGGDPLTKDESKAAAWGTGGPGYSFNDEITAQNKNDLGTIAMANSGPNTNGSQFFINVNNNNFLDTKHTVFGKVIQGLDIVKAISTTKVDASDRPVDPIVIKSITLK